jgi:hypothetical protein
MEGAVLFLHVLVKLNDPLLIINTTGCRCVGCERGGPLIVDATQDVASVVGQLLRWQELRDLAVSAKGLLLSLVALLGAVELMKSLLTHGTEQ